MPGYLFVTIKSVSAPLILLPIPKIYTYLKAALDFEIIFNII